ncbi:hypothetical protein [Xanthocytophaga agilis]|uniref:Uncharacterized protein n=1 Tax=Xanthocytophaga agilis TaxID=3048010 RepID=A0AAE3R9Z4_9BACT|nr:hypothetical protein [Xanthocytophaga agilis]MDJ1503497.1 hypothetical protein [Xanthocytophaga agilis]
MIIHKEISNKIFVISGICMLLISIGLLLQGGAIGELFGSFLIVVGVQMLLHVLKIRSELIGNKIKNNALKLQNIEITSWNLNDYNPPRRLMLRTMAYYDLGNLFSSSWKKLFKTQLIFIISGLIMLLISIGLLLQGGAIGELFGSFLIVVGVQMLLHVLKIRSEQIHITDSPIHDIIREFIKEIFFYLKHIINRNLFYAGIGIIWIVSAFILNNILETANSYLNPPVINSIPDPGYDTASSDYQGYQGGAAYEVYASYVRLYTLLGFLGVTLVILIYIAVLLSSKKFSLLYRDSDIQVKHKIAFITLVVFYIVLAVLIHIFLL